MYEGTTYEELLSRMLDTALSVNENLDSREGSLLWLGQAPAAVELQNLYIALDTVLRETFADTASRDYLILRAAERGLSPEPATPAVLQLSVIPSELELELNTRFSIGELNYYVSNALGDGKYELTCETPGAEGNNFTGAVIPIEYIAGLASCSVDSILIPGEDEEDTEVFRRRYLDSLNAQAFGGNQIDYIRKINSIPGVGGSKVYRAWNGEIKPADLIPPAETAAWISDLSNVPAAVKTWLEAVYNAANNAQLTVGGTVKAVIIAGDYSVPSDVLIDNVQTEIDPIQNAGEGVGLAPIGHVVKVEGVNSEKIDLAFSLTYESEWTWNDVEAYVVETLNKYFGELAKTWAEQDSPLVVRISQIESRLLDVAGVIDIADTTINGYAANHTLSPDHIPTLGAVTVSEMANL